MNSDPEILGQVSPVEGESSIKDGLLAGCSAAWAPSEGPTMEGANSPWTRAAEGRSGRGCRDGTGVGAEGNREAGRGVTAGAVQRQGEVSGVEELQE